VGILLVDIENLVQYQADTPDVSKFATNPDPTPSVNFREFSVATVLGDIVAVNGRPAKGLYASRARAIATSPSAKPGGGRIGQASGDVQHAAIREEVMEILNTDGTPIGSVMTLGLSGGPPPPGRPRLKLVQISRSWVARGHSSARGEFRARRRARAILPAVLHRWPRTPRTAELTGAEEFEEC
jgi:hypothetical protein